MAYWTESSWTVFASSAEECLQFKQKLPFALIGSDVHCHPRLPVHELKTAYFACNFDDRIEIWPLCAIAFPAWGTIPSIAQVPIGQYRLRFEKCRKTGDPPLPWNLRADAALLAFINPVVSEVELTMAWKNKSVTKAITRSVTILGSQHPSMWRTGGLGMRPCDHAIVCERGRVWLVDLDPSKKRLENPAVYEILANGEYYQVGEMRLSRGPASTQCAVSVARHQQPQSRIARPVLRQQPVSSSSTVAATQRVSCVAKFAALYRSAAQPPSARLLGNVCGSSVSHGVLEGFDCPEVFTSRLTGRMVSINQNRFTRVKLIRVGASAFTFVAASIFLVWLFQ